MSGKEKIEINQLLAGFAPDDAISNYARRLRRLFESWGCRSRILVDRSCLDPGLRNEASPFGDDRRDTAGQVLIYHFSIGSSATDYFLSSPGKRVVIYHNITPPEFFWAFQPETAAILEEGRKQLKQLAPVTDLALADSEYNRRELEAAGFKRNSVLPLSLDTEALQIKPSGGILRRLGNRRDHLLFVGRVAPNKKFEDLLRVFHYYSRNCRPGAKLVLVGKYRPHDIYYGFLRSLIEELELQNVVFTGLVRQNEMVAYYRRAGVFLSLSEHEGFGLPLLEAMLLGVPVMAFSAAAVTETMGGAGILITKKDYPAIAEMAALLAEDETLRRAVLVGQKKRIEQFQAISTEEILREALAKWLE